MHRIFAYTKQDGSADELQSMPVDKESEGEIF